MWTFPAEWEERLWQAARDELPAAALEPRALVPAIVERTRRYTDAREELALPLAGRAAERDLAARALFFTVADAAKLHIPLAELAGRGLLPDRPLAALDVGAGAGAMTLGLLSFLPGAHRITAVDRDARALAILRRAVDGLPGPRPEVHTVVADLEHPAALPAGELDLIVAGSVLNELPAGRHLALARDLLARVAPGGAAVIIEPALRETARALQALRDQLVAAGAAHVFAPCTRAGGCPALLDPRDWCHEDRPFLPPPRLADLARRTGLRARGLKFSYLTLRRSPEPLVDAGGRRALRVVSDALDQKGTVERIACGVDGRARLRALRRHRDDRTRALADSRRGDVLLVGEDGTTTRISPAAWPR